MKPQRQIPKEWVFNPDHKAKPRQDRDQGFATRALHAGYRPWEDVENFRSFVPPLIQSATFPYESSEKRPYFVYGRCKSPTTHVLEERLASMEGGEAALTACSGSQALFNLIMALARSGDNVVTSLNVFGEGYKQAASIFPDRTGIQFRFVKDPGSPESWAEEMDERTRLVWVETPSNPCLFITDIRSIADIAHAQGIPVMVDNTIATAALQQPLALGADIILLSITKFLVGNASVLGGAIVGPVALISHARMNVTEFIGAVLQPFDAWLTLQFLETLPLRMNRHSANAQKVAEFLTRHPKVQRVNYPGLADHPQHELARQQMKAYGGLLSFEVPGGMEGTAKVMDNTKLVVHAVTFGTSRSIFMHPATITHNHMTPEERAMAGIGDGLIRLSVGLEDAGDIIADLDGALAYL